MQNIFVACNTLRDEIKLVVEDLGSTDPIIWIESGLHDFPEKLSEAIQNQIDKIANVQNIILLFGSCGNSLLGLHSSNARIIFPKVDDCIALFLGGNERKRKIDKEVPSYYFTKGYLENESNIYSEYNYCIDKYGLEKAKKIYQKMLHNYQEIKVIDTKAYQPQEILSRTSKIADEFELTHQVVEGSLKFIYKAFNEEWDEDFVIIESGNEITYNDLAVL
ncbi:DUF1638 domain-containing protein [Natroniella sulfidigena]|uniref:DUF1638 domain-containing protein n=1 Tax=Natroniella sulfidigena TaxID=723921 RepID=UPI00200AF0B1|nr:DUF1638 domain-containing protein [Natroniella sulfidigena]MCK8817606.1 DUF1638 domain-containing protein [Natroniella sulfidigena]